MGVEGTPVNTVELTHLQRNTRISKFLFFSSFFPSAELWPSVLIKGGQISSTNAQIERQSLLRTQGAFNVQPMRKSPWAFQSFSRKN